MERQVETINKLVTSYMQIVAKMTRDYIPKTIMYHIVQNVNENCFFFHQSKRKINMLGAYMVDIVNYTVNIITIKIHLW